MQTLAGKTLVISGASRGIGLAIAKRAARDGANIAILAKTDTPHPKLPGTIHTAAQEIEDAGGKALPIVCDIRDEEGTEAAVNQAAEHFGGIDICINNASAINLVGTSHLSMKRYDLMHGVNSRGAYLLSKLCIPHLKKSENPHVLNISPPLDWDVKWFKPHAAYTLAKYGMSVYAWAMAEEFKSLGIAFNCLWPHTPIATAAIQNMPGSQAMVAASRTPEIMGDAAWHVLTKPSREFTGQFCIDDLILQDAGVTDFSVYQFEPGQKLAPDFFVPADCPPIVE
ncbi:MAG: SDR family oxidoreductase [Oceanococcus sp.]